jgi:hypothetical protein
MPAPPASPQALHQALLEHCHLAGWRPQHLGQVDQPLSLEDALLEIIASREGEATQLSLELIELCEQLGWHSPWLTDNRARCLVHQGRDEDAIGLWQQLAQHPDSAVAATAADTLQALARRPAAAVLANRIRLLREQDQTERWQQLLLQALLQSADQLAEPLEQLIADMALDLSPPPGSPWDPEHLRQELLLQLFERQQAIWEARP